MRVEEEFFCSFLSLALLDVCPRSIASPPDAAAPAFHQLMPLSSSAQPATASQPAHPAGWLLRSNNVIPIDSTGPTSCCASHPVVNESLRKEFSYYSIQTHAYLPRPTKSLCVCVWVIYSRKYIILYHSG